MMVWDWSAALDGGIGGLVVAVISYFFCHKKDQQAK